MSDVIDVMMNAQDIHLLHGDGRLTLCQSSLINSDQNRCIDPALFTDNRPGRLVNPSIFPETNFTQLLLTSPPDPSIFILDANGTTLYHFSLKLNLQRLLRPTVTLDSRPDAKPTAFTIGPNRIAFLAFGNRVFYGIMP